MLLVCINDNHRDLGVLVYNFAYHTYELFLTSSLYSNLIGVIILII